MVLKVYVSGMSGNKEVKKRQQRVLMILDSKNFKYESIDITEPGKESEKDTMQTKSTSNGATVSDPNPRHPLPPQIFNDDAYCGDYDAFDLANEIDILEQFLKLEPADTTNVTSAQIELKKDISESAGAADVTSAAVTAASTDKLDDVVPLAEDNKENEQQIKEPKKDDNPDDNLINENENLIEETLTSSESQKDLFEIEQQKVTDNDATGHPSENNDKDNNEANSESDDQDSEVTTNGVATPREMSVDKLESQKLIESEQKPE